MVTETGYVVRVLTICELGSNYCFHNSAVQFTTYEQLKKVCFSI